MLVVLHCTQEIYHYVFQSHDLLDLYVYAQCVTEEDLLNIEDVNKVVHAVSNCVKHIPKLAGRR
jgi:hypothetical protein